MSKKPETKFSEKVCKDLAKVFGKFVTIFNIDQECIIDDPDLLICLNGNLLRLS